jgi:hypothetical protein
MSRRRFSDARKLLSDLLDRYEANQQAERLLAYLDMDSFSSVAAMDAFLAELAVVERAGGVLIRRRRGGSTDHAESIRLGAPEAVYRHLGRMPASQKADQALVILERQASTSVVLAVIVDEVRRAWARNARAFGLEAGDSARLITAIDLAHALVMRLQTSDLSLSDFRSFSRATVGDSKALERLSSVVAAFARRLAPDAVAGEARTPEEVIGAFGITRLPQPFLISGPLSLDGRELPPLPYVGLPSEQVPRLTFARPPAYLLIIENFTSFVRHVREVNEDIAGAVVFSGGFPSRLALEGIVHVARLVAAPIYHWGDIDLGGLRIFIHIERTLAESGLKLQPHLMSEGLLRKNGSPARQRAWVRALQPFDESGIHHLWQALTQADLDLDLEQEAVAPERP